MRQIFMEVTPAQLATMIAALDYYVTEGQAHSGNRSDRTDHLATYGSTLEPLGDNGVRDLIDELTDWRAVRRMMDLHAGTSAP